MARIDDADALKALRAAFAEQSVDVQFHANLENLAEHVRTNAAVDRAAEIPSNVTSGERQYLLAVHDNTVAKLRYAEAIAHLRKATVHSKDPRPTQAMAFSSHLDALRQERLHRNLSTIESYLAEVDSLRETTKAIKPAADSSSHHISDFAPEIYAAYSKIDDLMSELEIAVLEADHDAELEAARLQEARTHVGEVGSAQKLHALIGVRDQLTAWLEDSLAACAEEEDRRESAALSRDRLTPDMVQDTYDGYVSSRRTLLQSAATLSVPVQPQKRPLEALEAPGDLPILQDIAMESEHRHLVQQSSATMDQIQRHVSNEINGEQERSVNALLRLAEESQLLAQYPLLSRNERYGKLIKQLGSMSSQGENRVTEQISAWAFAADAAGKSTSGALQMHLKEANAALDEFDDALKDLQVLRMDATP